MRSSITTRTDDDCRLQIANCRFHSAIADCRSAVIISGSFWRKVMATSVAAGGFVWLYETTILDSKYAARQATRHEATALPAPGERVAFTATAYCKGIVTTSGVAVQAGVAAADPEMLPVGSV